jgi:uncharacterized membrane protein
MGARTGRHLGIDAARGLAVVLMIQTHAYDAYVGGTDRASFAYAVTRQLGAIPAPLFLLLAGVGIAFAEARAADVSAPRAQRASGGRASAEREPGGESPLVRLRRKLARRGMEIVLFGYGVSLAYAALDGTFRLASVLRADILHAIGLSIALSAILLVGSRSALRAAIVMIVALAANSIFAWAGGAALIPAPLAPIAALFVDVPPYTRFPLLPLVVFCAVGLFVGRHLAVKERSPSSWISVAVVLAMVAAVLTIATRASVDALGGTLSRAHPAVVLNVLDGSARALSVVAIGLALGASSPSWLVRLGRASLFAYAFHVPFCYSRWARPLRHAEDMLAASALVLVLIGLTFAAVLARDALRARLASRRAAAS